MNKVVDDRISAHPGAIPVTPVIWPAPQHRTNQIQQTKASAKPQSSFVLPTTQPSASIVPPRTTPQHVSNVRVVARPAVNGQKTITVQFNHPSGDPHFQGASVYLKKAGPAQQPTQVASGNKSPLSFTVPVSTAPHAIHVTSWGNWGETNVLTSPSHPVRLSS
jgi:hypothetical protein